MNCPSTLGPWCRSDLDDQIGRHFDDTPHIANAKKGNKMTPICRTNRGNST